MDPTVPQPAASRASPARPVAAALLLTSAVVAVGASFLPLSTSRFGSPLPDGHGSTFTYTGWGSTVDPPPAHAGYATAPGGRPAPRHRRGARGGGGDRHPRHRAASPGFRRGGTIVGVAAGLFLWWTGQTIVAVANDLRSTSTVRSARGLGTWLELVAAALVAVAVVLVVVAAAGERRAIAGPPPPTGGFPPVGFGAPPYPPPQYPRPAHPAPQHPPAWYPAPPSPPYPSAADPPWNPPARA